MTSPANAGGVPFCFFYCAMTGFFESVFTDCFLFYEIYFLNLYFIFRVANIEKDIYATTRDCIIYFLGNVKIC
jgi:hypothetical protein